MTLPHDLKAYLESTTAALNLRQHPYFHGLLSGRFSKEQFLDSQNQFSYLVKYFCRPMAAVIANMPNALNRSAIVSNLWEEHGRGDPEKIHGKTIRRVDRFLSMKSSPSLLCGCFYWAPRRTRLLRDRRRFRGASSIVTKPLTEPCLRY